MGRSEDQRPNPPSAWPWIWLGLLEIGAAWAFFGFDALPFQDLPAHAGLIALRDRLATSTLEHEYWVLAPHIGGYSLFRWLGHLLARPLGALGAVRFLAAVPCLLFPAALLFARRRLYGELRPSFGFLGLVLSFGLMTLFGFASYLIALGLVIVGLVLWLELLAACDAEELETRAANGSGDSGPDDVVPRRSPSLRALRRTREAKIAMAAAVIVVAHGFAFILFVILCAVIAIASSSGSTSRLRRAAAWRRARELVYLAPAFALAAWSALVERSEPVPAGSVPWLGHEPPVHFQGIADKLSLLVTPTLMTRYGVDVALCLGLWVWMALALAQSRSVEPASGAGSAWSHARALRAAALAALGLFLVLPHGIRWFGFVDGRVVPLILMLGFLALPRAQLSGRLANAFEYAIPAAATAMVALVLVASSAFQAEARGYREVLEQVPTGARLLNLPLGPNSHVFTAHPFVHYDKLILVDRPLVASDVWFHQGSALYPTRRNPALLLPADYIESDLGAVDWRRYRLDQWDYVLIRLDAAQAPPPVPSGLTLVRHEGGWWLFHVAPAS